MHTGLRVYLTWKPHSAVTQKVIVIEAGKVNIHAVLLMFASGQLRFLGLSVDQLFSQSVDALQRLFQALSMSRRMRLVGRPCSRLSAGSAASRRCSAACARVWMLSAVSS